MNINFREDTYQMLCHLATRDERSVAAFVANLCDQYTRAKVHVEYTIKNEDDAPIIDSIDGQPLKSHTLPSDQLTVSGCSVNTTGRVGNISVNGFSNI